MSIYNPPKAFIVLASLVCLTLLIVHGSIRSNEGLPVITAIVGYAIGNGIAAHNGQSVDPIVGKKSKP